MRSGLVGLTLLALSSSAKAFSKNPLRTSLATSSTTSLAMSTSSASFYALSGTRSDGLTLSMSDLEGKVVYATNVASQ